MNRRVSIPLQPKQKELLVGMDDDATSVFGIGGAKGTGKSRGLRDVMLLRRFKYPGTMGLLFRKVYNDLLENQLNRMFIEQPYTRQWYNKNERLMTLPNGSSIRFGYAEHDADIDQYNGKEYHDIMIDQAEQCSVYQLSMLKGCKRPPSGTELRKSNIVMSFNPGGQSADWLKKKFVDSDLTTDEFGEGWKFIQAYAWDNAHWVRDVLHQKRFTIADYYYWTDAARRRYFLEHAPYAKTLKSYPDENLVRAYLWGEWDVFSGSFFTSLKDEHHLIPDDVSVNESWNRRGAIDYGTVTVFATGACDNFGRIIVDEAVRVEEPTPSVKAEIIGNLIIGRELWGLRIVGDTDMFGDYSNYAGAGKSPAEIMKQTWAKMFDAIGRPGDAPSLSVVSKKSEEQKRYRIQCNEAFREYLHWKKHKTTGEILKSPRLVFKEHLKPLYDTLKTLQYDKSDPLDLDDKIGDDHFFDASKMLVMALRTTTPVDEVLTFEKDPRAFIMKQIAERAGRSSTMIGADGTIIVDDVDGDKTFMQY